MIGSDQCIAIDHSRRLYTVLYVVEGSLSKIGKGISFFFKPWASRSPETPAPMMRTCLEFASVMSDMVGDKVSPLHNWKLSLVADLNSGVCFGRQGNA